MLDGLEAEAEQVSAHVTGSLCPRPPARPGCCGIGAQILARGGRENHAHVCTHTQLVSGPHSVAQGLGQPEGLRAPT